MRRFRLLTFLIALATFVVQADAGLAQHGAGVQQVLDRARAASGGTAWRSLRGLHETGVENGAPYQRWVDALRYGDRLEIGAAGAARVTRGYNGFGVWSQAAAGRPEGGDRLALARARSDAFIAAFGYHFPGRFDSRSGYVGARETGGRRFTVIWIQPAGGAGRELWFDRDTGLLAKVSERDGARPLTVEYADYRRVGRLLLPFRQTTYGGDLVRPLERSVNRMEAKAPDRALFSLARPG